MYSHPGGYQQPQYGHHPSQTGGPPPAKRAKGNPIITRYPPPPGYKGTTQPGAPYVAPTWQGTYGQPSPYGGYQQHQYAQPSYQPQFVGYPQQQQHPLPAFPPAPTYFPGPQPSWQPPISAPQSAPSTAWQPQPPMNAFHQPTRRHNSAPYATTGGAILDGNGDPMPPLEFHHASSEDLEEDFDGECYFARYPDEINPDLSLGVIEWKAPMPAKRALPPTFQEAELEALAPRIPLPEDDESISEYFTIAKRHEALLSVRQTDSWNEIKDYLIFREFPAVPREFVTLRELLEKWRDRYDPNWAEAPRSPTPGLSRQPTPARPHSRASTNGHAMEVDDDRASSIGGRDRSETPGSRSGLLDDLEEAIWTNSRPTVIAGRKSASHSRAGSVSSQHRIQLPKITRPKALPPIHDERQEDILAALGVTGSPKLVYQTPGPAFGPPPTTAGSERHSKSRTNSASSAYGAQHAPFPFAIGEHDPATYIEGCTQDRPSSATSRRSSHANGKFEHDCEPNHEATPRPKHFQRDNTRKRSYADSEAGAQRHEEDDEDTPRQKSKYVRVD